jgi:hypothetical protein
MVQEDIPTRDQVPVRAVIQAVDKDALLEGEDPTSTLTEDAEHWISVYRELISYKESLLDTSAEQMDDLKHVESMGEVSEIDGVILAAELERFRRRLSFWQERLDELRRPESS